MGSDHDRAVDQFYQEFLSYVEDDTYRWDCILRETEYFDTNESSMYYNNPKGELDIALLDLEDKALHYIEVKTRYKDRESGKDQLERAKEFFEERGYEFTGAVYVAEDGEVGD